MRDYEYDVADVIAQVLAPEWVLGENVFAGPYPQAAPDKMVACRLSGGGSGDDYIVTGRTIFRPLVQVFVRGEVGRYKEALDAANAVFEALYLASSDVYLVIKPEGPGPEYGGVDENGRHVFSIEVQLQLDAAIV